MNSFKRSLARFFFYSHLWVGVILTALLLVIGVTGVLLNHKVPLGLMPDIDHVELEDPDQAISISEIVSRANAIYPDGPAPQIDRIDVRLRSGYAKVRYRDDRNFEVTLDLRTGEVLQTGERNDVFIEKLHSGEIFGDRWILLSDVAAIGLTLLLISGYWLWLFPKWKFRGRAKS